MFAALLDLHINQKTAHLVGLIEQLPLDFVSPLQNNIIIKITDVTIHSQFTYRWVGLQNGQIVRVALFLPSYDRTRGVFACFVVQPGEGKINRRCPERFGRGNLGVELRSVIERDCRIRTSQHHAWFILGNFRAGVNTNFMNRTFYYDLDEKKSHAVFIVLIQLTSEQTL